ncbi:MAG TPA: hypothetical protein VF013_01390 [Candidatus Limnocylindria bacterium]
MNARNQLSFVLTGTAIGQPVSVRLAAFGERWVASVECGSARSQGLGAAAREALVAALAPFGARATAALMADPAMFGASASLLAMAPSA